MSNRPSPETGRLSLYLGRCMALMTAGLFACSDSAPTLTDFEPQFAPGGGGPPVKVTATDPASGQQGTTLSVRVLGSNFEPGSLAQFTLEGVPGKIHTDATLFVSDTELIADITIDSDADLGLYDVEVTTIRGKKGVGTELFEVSVPGGGPPDFSSTSLSILFRDAAGDAVASDGNGAYLDNTDGVRAFVYLGPDSGFEGQIHLNTDWDDQDAALRTLQLDLNSPSGSEAFFNAAAIVRFSIHGGELDAFNALALGESLNYRMHFQFEDDAARYDLRFGSECGGGAERPAERVLVTLVQEAPKAWEFSHSGNGLLCVSPAKGKGKPVPDYSVVVAAPFGMLAIEAD